MLPLFNITNPRPRNRVSGWLLTGFIMLWLFLSNPVHAQTEPPSDIQMAPVVGLDGYCVYDRWLPVRVTLENTGQDLDGRVEVQTNNGLNEWSFSQPVALPAVSRKEVTVFAYLYGSPNLVTTSFVTDEGVVATLAQNLTCLQGGTSLVGVWASTPSVYNLLTTLSFSGGRGSIAVMEMADMPTHPEGLDMLTMLIISDVDTGSLSEAQQQAITSWVEAGGRLMIVGGPGWQKTSAGLETLLPLQVSGTTNLPDLSGLDWLSPDGEPLTGDSIAAVGTLKPEALILAAQGETPLILRQDVGYGDVYFMAVDPALAPLRNWVGLEQMYQFMFATQLDVPTWANGFTSWPEASSAVSNIPGLGLPSILLICGFLGLYTLALGPLNYLVLHRLKRRELAWVTIPVLVIMFSCVAFVLGLGVRGTRSIVNQLAIVEVWPERTQAQVHGLVGVFSPNRSKYHVQINGGYLAHPIVDNMLGSTQNWLISQRENEIAIEDLRIDAGGIEGLAVVGETEAPAFSSALTLNFGIQGNSIQGDVQNNSTLTLRDAVVLGPGQVQQVGDFEPGDRVNVQLSLFGSSGISPNSTAPYTYPYGYDNTMQDVFGTTYVGGTDDQALVRRFNLLQAALGYGGTRGGGVYLVGWTDTSPLDVTLDGKGFKEEHTSIYIIALTPTYQAEDASILTLPPVMFNWERLDTGSYQENTPYNSYFYTGVYQFRYRLNQPIPYEAVKALTFHLTDYGGQGPHGLNISLWDFSENAWTAVDATEWGDNVIPDPERFVGFGGEIRLQIENLNQTSVDIERADFTLIVEQ